MIGGQAAHPWEVSGLPRVFPWSCLFSCRIRSRAACVLVMPRVRRARDVAVRLFDFLRGMWPRRSSIRDKPSILLRGMWPSIRVRTFLSHRVCRVFSECAIRVPRGPRVAECPGVRHAGPFDSPCLSGPRTRKLNLCIALPGLSVSCAG